MVGPAVDTAAAACCPPAVVIPRTVLLLVPIATGAGAAATAAAEEVLAAVLAALFTEAVAALPLPVLSLGVLLGLLSAEPVGREGTPPPLSPPAVSPATGFTRDSKEPGRGRGWEAAAEEREPAAADAPLLLPAPPSCPAPVSSALTAAGFALGLVASAALCCCPVAAAWAAAPAPPLLPELTAVVLPLPTAAIISPLAEKSPAFAPLADPLAEPSAPGRAGRPAR